MKWMLLAALMLTVFIGTRVLAADAPYPASTYIIGVDFDMSTLKELAPGSDNWCITWADNNHQYTSWGDGGGFGGTNSDGRVSMGVGRVEGSKSSYTGHNVWGGKNPEASATFTGKSYGILAIGSTLYMWRGGEGSDAGAFNDQKLYRSTDYGKHWIDTGVEFNQSTDPNTYGVFCPTFLQFGKAYAGARDNYVYSYGPEIQNKSDWNVQKPGKIALMRVLKQDIEDQSKYEFFDGLDGNGDPTWTTNYASREPVFSDPVNGVMRTSVSYNPGIGRYFLITQQLNRFKSSTGHMGMYEAPEPWGPWRTVVFADAWTLGTNGDLHNGSKTVYWNFSNKWLSADGKSFVLVYTGNGADNWGTVEGTFTIASGGNTPPTVDAGSSQTITLPDDDVDLDATVTDPDDTPGTTWSKQSGPGTVTFGNASIVDTSATFSTHGTYVLKLSADDGTNPVVSDAVTVTVNPEPGPDTDSDGMDDAWELTHFGNLGHNGNGDGDADGLTDLEEFLSSTDPGDADSDNDGMTDGWELDNGLAPTSSSDATADADSDGMSNVDEFIAGTDPNNNDSDSDGLLDGVDPDPLVPATGGGGAEGDGGTKGGCSPSATTSGWAGLLLVVLGTMVLMYRALRI